MGRWVISADGKPKGYSLYDHGKWFTGEITDKPKEVPDVALIQLWLAKGIIVEVTKPKAESPAPPGSRGRRRKQ